MAITVSSFGRIGDREAKLNTVINSSGASVRLCDFGAHLVSVCVPDRNGCIKDVCLGFDDASCYDAVEYSFYGGTIGRVGNRIANGRFDLNGKSYHLYRNNGKNTLHGGQFGFDRHWWQGEIKGENTVVFSRISPDGEEGFPGAMSVSVAFTWTQKNALRIEYTAFSDQDTPCNLTNHAYFNLGNTRDILDHTITVYADTVTQVREDLIPTGIDEPVDHLPCDLRKGLTVREGLARSSEYPIMVSARGYDFNYPICGEGFRLCAEAYTADSGRLMQVYSTEPCLQLYTGQYMDARGRNGQPYGKHGGFAMETQHHPDAIHHPQFPTTLLKAGDICRSVTEYRFSLK